MSQAIHTHTKFCFLRRYVISPLEGVHATRTDITRLQNSSDDVKRRYSTVLYSLYDKRKTRIIDTSPDGTYIQRSESLRGSIIRLGTSYMPLTQESLAFFKQNVRYLRPGPSTRLLPGCPPSIPLLILAPPETTITDMLRLNLNGVDRVLDSSRASAEVLPIGCVTLSKACLNRPYQPRYLFHLVLDFIRLCSHHCAAGAANAHLLITDLELDEADIVYYAVSLT